MRDPGFDRRRNKYAGGPPGRAKSPGKANGHDGKDIACLTSTAPLNAAQVANLARLYRDFVMRDKSYQKLPVGQDAAEYLRSKRRRLTPGSLNAYESVLDKLARHFADLRGVEDFEPPVGVRRLEEFLNLEWGHVAPASFNRNLSILGDFFKWAQRSGRLHADPTLGIERAKTRDVHRETFNGADVHLIVAENPDLRDRIALRLLLNYALRKGALRAVQFKHFDHQRKRLVIFTKGGRVQTVPIPDPAFWDELGRLLIDLEAQPGDYLMCRQRRTPTGGVRRFPDQPMGEHATHDWWYRCLARAGVSPAGVTSGERMHKARHTAGQRVLDATGNLKAVQKLLGHASISTTADSYVDWDVDQLAATLATVLTEGQ
jgi:site-specific recombinase XerC